MATVARAEPAAEIAGLADWHTAEVGANACICPVLVSHVEQEWMGVLVVWMVRAKGIVVEEVPRTCGRKEETYQA